MMLNASFENYSQSLRMLMEAVRRSNDLIFVDPFEASGNIEQGFTNLLNAFHSLYDAIRTEKIVDFDWYGTPETATLLAIRNARHHNFANKVRGLYAYHLEKDQPADIERYIIVDYPETEEGGTSFQTLISWKDMKTIFSLSRDITRLGPNVHMVIKNYLNDNLMDSYSSKFSLPAEVIFFNATPLIVNASKKIIPLIKDKITARSTEAKVFINLFDHVYPANTQAHILHEISIFLPI